MSGKSTELVRLFVAPRGRQGEELRVSLDEFAPDNGDIAKYVSLRVWFRGREQMLPGKVGCTVRRAELRKVIEALLRAEAILNGKEPAANNGGVANRSNENFDMAREDAEALF